jgi:hypothetical protein
MLIHHLEMDNRPVGGCSSGHRINWPEVFRGFPKFPQASFVIEHYTNTGDAPPPPRLLHFFTLTVTHLIWQLTRESHTTGCAKTRRSGSEVGHLQLCKLTMVSCQMRPFPISTKRGTLYLSLRYGAKMSKHHVTCNCLSFSPTIHNIFNNIIIRRSS